MFYVTPGCYNLSYECLPARDRCFLLEREQRALALLRACLWVTKFDGTVGGRTNDTALLSML